MIEVLKHILAKQYKVECKTDAADVYGAIVSFAPDLIMMDNFIGEKNAAEVIFNLKNANPSFSVPIILFSAAHNIGDIATTLGTTGYLSKPASISEIREYIKKFVE